MILTGNKTFQRVLQREILDDPDPYGIRSWCGPLDTIIDLGANCGMFSLLARFTYPLARVISLEPDPDNFQALTANTDHLRIECINAAIGDGYPVFLTNPGQSPGCLQYRRSPSLSKTIRSYRLSEFWNALKPQGRIFLKIDVEGAEQHFVGNETDEAHIASCSVVGAEIHAGPRYSSPFTIGDYRKWSAKFARWSDVDFQPDPKAHLRLAQLRMRKR